MALIALLLGLSWPALSGPLRQRRLSEGARQLRVELASARLDAVERGATAELRYQPGESRFRVIRRVAVRPMGHATGGTAPSGQSHSAGSAQSGGMSASSAAEGLQYEMTEMRLPEGVVFVEQQTDLSGSSLVNAPISGISPATSIEAASEDAFDGTWSEGVRFYADGRTDDARFLLKNDSDRYVEVTLRGLTGVARSGAIMSDDELSQRPDTSGMSNEGSVFQGAQSNGSTGKAIR